MRQFLTLLFLLTLILANAQEYRVEVDLAHDGYKVFKGEDTIEPTDIKAEIAFVLDIFDNKNIVKNLKYKSRDKARKQTIDKILTISDLFSGGKIGLVIKKDGQKMVIGNGTDNLLYPYYFEILDKDNKILKVVELGKPSEKIVDPPNIEKPSSTIDITDGFKNIDISKIYPITNDPNSKKGKENTESKIFNFCDQQEKCNAILNVDFANFPSNKTMLYRKDKNGDCKIKCCNKELRWGDNLKVYISNINPYKHKISISSNFTDNVYGTAFPIDTSKIKKTADKDVESTSSSDDDIMKLINYEKAVTQLKIFIEQVKNDNMPDAFLLEAKKKLIIENLYSLGLDPDYNIDELYKTIDDDKYESNYKIAKQISAVYSEFKSLTYFVYGAIIPIKIRSFDQLVLKFTLYDSSNKIVKEEEHPYLIRGGFKVDQSYGIVIHSIRDKEFSLRSFMDKDTLYELKSNGERLKILLPDSSMKDSIRSISPIVKKEIMEEKSPSQYAIGLSTLTHLYYRFTGVFSIGPEVGISADLYPKTDLRYLLGLGMLFKDERHRISLDIGYAFGKSMAFSQGQNYGTILTGEQANPSLIEQHQKKLYIGISYNVPLNLKNTQEVKL